MIAILSFIQIKREWRYEEIVCSFEIKFYVISKALERGGLFFCGFFRVFGNFSVLALCLVVVFTFSRGFSRFSMYLMRKR